MYHINYMYKIKIVKVLFFNQPFHLLLLKTLSICKLQGGLRREEIASI